mmetsp:Transcript_5429/g.12135  ORF Transcript_5429/g.12135 Transcript_5429/m.12135 type:complete len:84 (-) Transcript_5429:185-436(-)
MGNHDTPALCLCWCSYWFFLVSSLLVLALVLGGDLSADAGVVLGLLVVPSLLLLGLFLVFLVVPCCYYWSCSWVIGDVMVAAV